MQQEPVTRTTLADHRLPSGTAFDHVEVRRITLAPSVQPGAHTHSGPVFGVIESGSAHVQLAGEPERVLRAGDTFYEPGDSTILRFDATDEGVTFLGWFPLPAGAAPEIAMGHADTDDPTATA
ncbi:cupin domain-containing protein [Herbiconiux sp. KACC 21604]|uniref:cupin domain-containing protein n=1 Tax=unclassified Herbiconiux TaxID=2618217 RepID=UPI0014921E17|nr:cupin domain-containing protein [Herbiconiux sp. SALV-R1]QJU53384.1 cupin domain-containing protein [Herbiconiux sp. SALV-R1]WPO88348.1 cupin domain-containing protein [Herbiconiux sp. KACC 21604]